MQILLLAAAAGMAFTSLLPVLHSIFLWFTLTAGCVATLFACRYSSRSLRAAACLLLGMAWAADYGLRLLDNQLPAHLQQEPVWVTGQVTGLPDSGEQQGKPWVRFDLAVDAFNCLNPQLTCDRFTRRVRLRWNEPPAIVPGQRWTLLIKAKRPRGLMNPGGFDYQSWLIQQGVGATGYVVSSSNDQPVAVEPTLDYRRWQLSVFLDRAMADLPFRPILKGLLIADKREISSAQWQLFKRHGIIHLMVISGLHVGLVSAWVFVLLRLVMVLVGRGNHAQTVAALGAMTAALLYCLAAGASLPTQRAFVMVACAMVMLMLKRESFSGTSLLLAAVLCLLLDPLAVTTASFWLSFGAVIALMIGLAGRVGRRSGWREIGTSQWLVFIGLMPLLAASFGEVSVDGALVNLLAVPLFALWVVPVTLLALVLAPLALPVSRWLWQTADSGVGGMIQGLQWIDRQFDPGLILLPTLPMLWIGLGVIGALLLMAPRGLPLRYLGVLLLAPLFCYQPPRPAQGELDFTVLDVGQGLSVVVETANHVLVYDVGARYVQDEQRVFSMSEVALLPFLRSRKIATLDALVLSHGDNDHAGAWPELLTAKTVKQIYAGEPVSGLSTSDCTKIAPWQWDGVSFLFLKSHFSDRDTVASSGNNRSCVLLVAVGEHRFLLPGDIEATIENTLVQRHAGDLQATLLLAPHHGSRTSSSWALLKRVRPDHVIFSAGYLNHFGHPHPLVVERYQHFDAALHSTSEHGAITFRLRDGKLLSPSHYRSEKRRYWLRD